LVTTIGELRSAKHYSTQKTETAQLAGD
jgi:hypothetical protein